MNYYFGFIFTCGYSDVTLAFTVTVVVGVSFNAREQNSRYLQELVPDRFLFGE